MTPTIRSVAKAAQVRKLASCPAERTVIATTRIVGAKTSVTPWVAVPTTVQSGALSSGSYRIAGLVFVDAKNRPLN